MHPSLDEIPNFDSATQDVLMNNECTRGGRLGKRPPRAIAQLPWAGPLIAGTGFRGQRAGHPLFTSLGKAFRAARYLPGVRVAVAVAVIYFLGFEPAMAGQESPVSRSLMMGYVIRGAVVPIWGEEGGQPYATLRVGAISRSYQRMGFFRIGSLPILVAERVNLECRDTARLGTAFEGMHSHLRHLCSLAPVELRGFRVVTASGASRGRVLFEAGRVRLNANNCEFSIGVVLHRPTGDVRTTRATLLAAGNPSRIMTLRTAESQIWRVTASEVTEVVPTLLSTTKP